MRIMAAISLLSAILTLGACAPVAMTAGGIAGGAGVNHALNGIAYKTFTAPVRQVRVATIKSLNRMEMKLTSDSKTEEGWRIEAVAAERTIEIELEALTPSATRMRGGHQQRRLVLQGQRDEYRNHSADGPAVGGCNRGTTIKSGDMKHTLAVIAFVMGLAVADHVSAQTKSARAGAYEALSDANRKIVSAIYESQHGSRRDLAGHALLSKDQITAMRRHSNWEDMFEHLAKQGYVAFRTLNEAISSYGRETVSAGRPLIISTGAGEQVIVPLRTAPRWPHTPNPALANIIPTSRTIRPPITVVELPVLTAAGADAQSASAVESTVGGLVAPGVAASSAQAR